MTDSCRASRCSEGAAGALRGSRHTRRGLAKEVREVELPCATRVQGIWGMSGSWSSHFGAHCVNLGSELPLTRRDHFSVTRIRSAVACTRDATADSDWPIHIMPTWSHALLLPCVLVDLQNSGRIAEVV